MVKKCIVMFSGGLDSRLAVRIMQERGYEVIALHFNLPFGCGCCNFNCNFKFTQMSGVKFKIIDVCKGKLLKEYLEVIRKGEHGRGAGYNPCRDCKIFIFKKAKKYADSAGIKIIATGEVLGQRPMSQTRKAMEIIDKEIGFEMTRPLIEIGVSGRSRKKQIVLAKKYKIRYPSPGGGCLLCEKALASRFKSLIKDNMINEKNLCLVSLGRHFINSKRWIVLGRDAEENKIIEKTKGIKIIPKQPGPSAWVSNKKLIPKAEKLIKKHSKHDIRDFEVKIK